jgi:hypothetical protein
MDYFPVQYPRLYHVNNALLIIAEHQSQTTAYKDIENSFPVSPVQNIQLQSETVIRMKNFRLLETLSC